MQNHNPNISTSHGSINLSLQERLVAILTRCGEAGSTQEWDDWRSNNSNQQINIHDARFEGLILRGVNLSGATLSGCRFMECDMEGANFSFSNLTDVQFESSEPHSKRPMKLRGANFYQATMCGSRLISTECESTNFRGANMADSHILDCDCQCTVFEASTMTGAIVTGCRLQRSNLRLILLDGASLITDCLVDESTDSRGAGLRSARIESGLLQFLEYSNRRLEWEDWYKDHPTLKYPVAMFWLSSDYARSTTRLFGWFIMLSFIFAVIYWATAYLPSGGLVTNLLKVENVHVPVWIVPFRAVYFSIVTMTTLGFGDIHAYPASFWGHALLTFQVLLGYILLGSLVTRVGTLFSGTGPCAKMAINVSDWCHFRVILVADFKKYLAKVMRVIKRIGGDARR